ncbi:MAG: hypothetical protein U0326_23720 [Polyangiales bacterium]
MVGWAASNTSWDSEEQAQASLGFRQSAWVKLDPLVSTGNQEPAIQHSTIIHETARKILKARMATNTIIRNVAFFLLLTGNTTVALASFRFVALLLQSVHGYPPSLARLYPNEVLLSALVLLMGIGGSVATTRAIPAHKTAIGFTCIAVGFGFVLTMLDVSVLERLWLRRCYTGDNDACKSLACLYSQRESEVFSHAKAGIFFARACRMGNDVACRRVCRPSP